MLFDALLIVLIMLGIAWMAAIGDLLLLWNRWLFCFAGGFTAGLLVCTQFTALPAEEQGVLIGAITIVLAIALRWTGDGHTPPAAQQATEFASEQPAIDDIFDFEEV